jgi:lipoprotein NlpD
MNKRIFAKRVALPVMAGLFALALTGCVSTKNAPVRDSRPRPRTTAPTPGYQTSPAAPRTGEHIVQKGETLYAVSRLYGVPVSDLVAWNNLTKPGQLEVGQILRVSPPGSSAPVQTETVPIAIGTETPETPEVSAPPVIKQEPLGGKLAWSDETWARLRQPQMPPEEAAVTPPTITPPIPVMPPSVPPSAPPAVTDWIWPVKGTIISKFSEATGGDGKVSNRGIDIAGTPGTPVLASSGGKVVFAGSALRGFGKLVIIRHNDEYLTAYAHNRVILVKENDTVAKGQKIAELGDTDADRPRLHFEVRKQGHPVDPLKYLPAM